MLNISQHVFLPRTRILSGYYALSGVYVASSNVCTTEMQTGDIYNTFQLFGSYVPVNYYVIRLFEPTTTQQGSNGVGRSSTTYVSPALVKKPNNYTSSAFTFSPLNNGLVVLSIMWFEIFDSRYVSRETLTRSAI